MFRYLGPGQILFAAGLAGLGALSLLHHDFALQWQPVPQGIPARAPLALASGGLLLIGAAALMFGRSARAAALTLALFLLAWVLVLQLPRLALQPLNIAAWLGLCESLALCVGGWVLYAWLDTLEPRATAGIGSTATAVGYARLLLGAAMVVFGLSHFAYADFTASMIPAWIPARLPLAYFTGAAHVAAGAALLLGIVPTLRRTAGGDHDERLHRAGARARGGRPAVRPRAVDRAVRRHSARRCRVGGVRLVQRKVRDARPEALPQLGIAQHDRRTAVTCWPPPHCCWQGRASRCAPAPALPRRPARPVLERENPYGPSPAARRVMAASIAEGCRYPPEDELKSLVRKIALHEGTDTQHIVIGTGSGELLRALVLVCCPRRGRDRRG